MLDLTFREFYFLQKKRKESMYYKAHQIYSIYAAILNLGSNLIYTISRVAGSKSSQKPKPTRAENLIGTLDEFMNGGKSKVEDTPNAIYSKVLMIFPDDGRTEQKADAHDGFQSFCKDQGLTTYEEKSGAK